MNALSLVLGSALVTLLLLAALVNEVSTTAATVLP